MNFNKSLNKSIENILTGALSGKYPIATGGPGESSFFGSGLKINLGETSITSTTPNTRNIVVQEPKASIIIKKKELSTLKHVNDVQWMDRTERMFLRSIKALFAYKCAQIRAYEALTKFEKHFEETNEIPLAIFADLLDTAKFLQTEDSFVTNFEALTLFVSAVNNSFVDNEYEAIREDVLKLMKRSAFQSELNFTTWIVDPDNTDNYGTGPGTGSIELGMFANFSTTTDLNPDPSSASIFLEDPYKISYITEDEIDLAIQEALQGTVGILAELSSGNIDATMFDAKSVIAASFELAGGPLDTGIDVDYIRDQLRRMYMGKPFINAGDSVSFFIRGNKTVSDFEKDEFFQEDFLKIDDTILEAERVLFTDKNIDLETYKRLRKLQENSLAMQQVYGGVVTATARSFNNGKWSLSVDCEDNMKWLNWSRFMIEPSLQDPQGILEDPLTPYEIKTDALGRPLVGEGPKLIEENIELLNSGLLTYDSGIFNGEFATENNLLQGQYNGKGSLSNSKIMQHPNGFVYRWKRGIITATTGVNLIDPLNEKDVTLAMLNQTYGLTVAEDVLNNLDAANILSLLVVGQPYNVETFMEQAYQAHNISKSTSVSSLSVTDPLTSVIDVIRRQNIRFGHFRPYRMITMSNSTLEQNASANIIRGEVNEKIKLLRQRKVELTNIIQRLEVSDQVGNSILIRTLNEEVQAIQSGIQEQIKIATQTQLDSADIFTENFNLFGRNRVLPLTGNFTADYDITRAMMIVGAQRRIEDVRLNRDDNLFIVSDQYEENTDIRPFILKLRDSNYNIFRGNFVSVFEKCKAAAGFVNFEFFCNPQGHLIFRPPQWNRTPKSVLERMFEISDTTEKNIVPDFLRDIFETRSASLRREIHSLNIRIAMLSLLLGKYPDSSLIPNFRDPVLITKWKVGNERITKGYLRFFGVNPEGLLTQGEKGTALRFSQGTSTVFGDLVNTGNQLIGDGLSVSFGTGEEGDVINADTSTILGIFDPVFQEQKNLVVNLLTAVQNPEAVPAIEYATPGALNKLREEFRKVAGLDPAGTIVGNTEEFIDKDFTFFAGHDEGERIRLIEKYLEELSSTISSRDRLVTILLRNQEKEKELDEIESILAGEFSEETGGTDSPGGLGALSELSDRIDSTTETLSRVATGLKTISDIFSGEATKNSLFDHLVEDDTRNLLGPGSGRRYIIEDHDIISCTFTESPPAFNRIDIVGDAPLGVGQDLQRQFEDRYFWAGATDFDSWRQYGYIYGGTKNLPYANDPELQCRPFAIMELQLQRTQINKAVVTLVGNEYYEPGDVVFIRDQGLLYYIRSVSHSFSWGGSFETQLILENGHPPGQYLPSPLDIIGQQLTKDFLEDGPLLIYRNQRGDDSYRALQPDSNIIFPPNIDISPQTNLNLLLDFKNNQVRYTNMIIDLNTVAIGNRVVLLRGFVRNESDETEVRANLKVVRYMLENPSQMSQANQGGGAGGDDIFDIVSEAAANVGVNIGNTKNISSMVLPNGLIAEPIKAEQIVEQIVFLDGENTRTEVQCLNAKILNGVTLEENIKSQIDMQQIDPDDYVAVFPKGGPKQSSWLDLRDDITNIKRIIEVGILDIDRSIENAVDESGIEASVDIG